MSAGHLDVKVSQKVDLAPDADNHMKIATSYLGTREAVRGRSNPVVEKMFQRVTGKVYDAIDTPWCAAFVGDVLEEDGQPSTKALNARSYLHWGEEVSNGIDNWDDVQEGDIAVIWRGKCDDKVTGHVFFVLETTPERVKGLGGNQSDMVCVRWFDKAKVLSVRRSRHWTKSRTIRAAVGSAGFQAGAEVSKFLPDTPPPKGSAEIVKSTFESALEPLHQLATFKPWIYGVCSVISIGLILYAAYCRFDDHQSGRNV